MSISYDPNERNRPLARVPRRQSLTNAESQATNLLGSPPLSRSSLHSCGSGYPEISDDDLITGAQCGDQQAFVELCGRYSSIVKKKILRIVGNREDAEDALQDALLRAYTHVGSFRRSCKFSTWLTAIGMNSALMIIRKRRVRREIYAGTCSLDTETLEQHEPIDRSLGADEVYLKQEAILLVRREIEKLRPSLRSVVNHYYGSDFSLEEAAKALDISVSAAKCRLLRGRARLRSSLVRYGIPKFGN
jgi:RNA polymerase sigma-70 factor, ECF subfamily